MKVLGSRATFSSFSTPGQTTVTVEVVDKAGNTVVKTLLVVV